MRGGGDGAVAAAAGLWVLFTRRPADPEPFLGGKKAVRVFRVAHSAGAVGSGELSRL